MYIQFHQKCKRNADSSARHHQLDKWKDRPEYNNSATTGSKIHFVFISVGAVSDDINKISGFAILLKRPTGNCDCLQTQYEAAAWRFAQKIKEIRTGNPVVSNE